MEVKRAIKETPEQKETRHKKDSSCVSVGHF
jgi:hypothetical protein